MVSGPSSLRGLAQEGMVGRSTSQSSFCQLHVHVQRLPHGHEIYTVRYEAVNAMLLNEFIKEHRKSRRARLRPQVVNNP